MKLTKGRKEELKKSRLVCLAPREEESIIKSTEATGGGKETLRREEGGSLSWY